MRASYLTSVTTEHRAVRRQSENQEKSESHPAESRSNLVGKNVTIFIRMKRWMFFYKPKGVPCLVLIDFTPAICTIGFNDYKQQKYQLISFER